jgi:hypothetical protein
LRFVLCDCCHAGIDRKPRNGYLELITTTKEIAVDALRPLGLHAGDSLHVLEEKAGVFLMEIMHAAPVPHVAKRGSAGDWARAARGSARLAADETREDARLAYYQEKFGVR